VTITTETNVTVEDGAFKVLMGKGMTSLYYKGQEKFVFHTAEIKQIISLFNAGLEELEAKIES